MDICMGAGMHPGKVKTDEEVARFEETANRWIQNAAFEWMDSIATTDAAELVARGNGNLQPVSQMPQPELMSRFSAEELAAIQWQEFDERIANAVEFDIVPDYDRLCDIYSAANRARGQGCPAPRRPPGR